MGAASSALNCGSKKDKDKKRKKDKNSNQTLSKDIEKYQDNVDALRNSGGEVERRVSQRDKDLVEDRLKNREKRYNDVKARTEKIQKGFGVLELDLEEIQGKVDQYLSWLKKKEEQALLTLPQGYNVGEAEEKVQYLNNLCMDLENRQFTLDTVNKKVETILPDLSARDREEMEQSLHALGTEHQRVYEVAIAQKNLLAESLNTREVFQVGLERVELWLRDREAGITNLEKLRLTAADVEKQAEKAKALQTEVEKYEPNISQVESRIQVLLPECQAETSTELQQKLQDVQTRYADLKTHLKDVYDKIRTNASARKVYETDLQKVDRWCKETDMKCAIEPALDCATEVLQQQYKQYKTLDNTAEMFNSLMKEVQERADTFQPQLNEADTMTLQQQTKTTHDKLDRISKLIKDRLKSLEEALQSRDQLGEGIQEATDWLEAVQVDLRKIPRSIGPTVNEAEDVLKKYEDVAEKIANYQPTVAQLNQAVERLRHLGQNSEAEEVLRITSQYETLSDQVKQQTKKCQQAMSSRQQLEDKIKEMDGVIKECEDSADSVIGLAVPIPEKIEKLQAVSTKLHSAAPVLFTMGDRAQQIGIEGTPNDAIAVSSMVEDVRARVDNLKKIADRKIRQCESIQKNREDFQGTVDETINWLESKEDILASCGSLDLDPVKVKSTLQKHQDLAMLMLDKIDKIRGKCEALSRDALDKLDTVKMKATMEQTHYQDMEEPVPDQLTEKLEQINTLEDSIKEAISKKEQYLTEATADRMQLEVSMKQIHEWIHGAEDMLDSGYEGLDYDTLNDTISEHKDYFSEASMCQDEMDQVMELSERLLPTLDMNDTETLRESLKNTSQKLADVMAASQRKQQVMTKKCEEWNEYQEMVMKVNGDLQMLETEWEELDSVQLNSPTQIQKHLTDTKEFIDKVETFRPVINELNERSHDLDREAAQKSQQLINELMTNVNSRWKDLVGQTENKQMILQDLEAQYEDYSQLLHAVDLALDEAESKIPATVDLDNVKCPDLVAQLNQTQDLMETIETAEPKITALKKCAHQLQKGLPTAEAKVQSQDIVMAMLEKYERIADKAKESKQMLQEEIDDREGFNTEAVQTVDWLTETKTELQQLGATMEVPEVMEKIEKLKLSEQEIAIRMEQMRHMAQLQETKYKSQGREVPRELRDQIENMVILEKEVTTTMKTKEEELLHLKADRQNYSTELKVITTWLAQAREQLQERVMDIPEVIYRHEELLGEFDPFKKKLDNLRNQGGDLIKHTSDPVEKTSVQKQLADANKQWLSLQAQAAEKTRQLQQAEALAKDFTQTVEALEGWAEQAEATLVAEPAWTDFERVKEQLKQHRRLLKDSDQQQNKLGHLNAIVKQMELLCDVVPQMEKFADLSHRSFDIRARTSDKVNDLEEIAEQIEDYEIELADLKHWMDKTRAHLTMRDDTLTLNDQLRMQENLISDIESHKGKALFVLQKHAELHAAIGEDSPLHNTKLAAEINTLLQQAHEDCDELREAVAQQDQYESEMRQLTKSIKEAQEQLLGSPIQASSVETLKQQISEHNELAQQIKAYQARINELSEKSHELAERSADLGPLCARKLYHTGYRETTVSELVDALNAPLEPYVSPLPSPRSPGGSLKYQYENPLHLSKSSDGHLNSLPTDLSSLITGSGRPSDSLSKSLPSFHAKTLPKSGRDDHTKYSGGQSSSGFRDGMGLSPTDSGINFSSHGSGLSDLKSSGKLPSANDTEVMAVATSVPKSYATFPSKRTHSEERESGDVPSKYKSLRSSDAGSLESASVKSGSTDEPAFSVSEPLETASSASALLARQSPYSLAKSPATNVEPSWKISDSLQLPRKESLRERPLGQRGARQAGSKYEPSKVTDIKGDKGGPMTPEELESLQARKTEALAPYSSKYYHIAAVDNDSGDDKPKFDGEFESLANDFESPVPIKEDTDMQAENGEASLSSYDFKSWRSRSGPQGFKVGPLKAEHDKFSPSSSKEGQTTFDRSRSQSPKSGRESDSSPDFTSMRGRKSYQPRSPSPLTLDSHGLEKSKFGRETPKESGYKLGLSHGSDRNKSSLSDDEYRSFSPRTSGILKSGSHGAIPSLTVSPSTESPVSKFSSGDGIDRHPQLFSFKNGDDAQGYQTSDSKELSKSLTTQAMKSLHLKMDHPKAGGGLLHAGKRDTDLSRSVPSLLDPHLQVLRDRSSSFGSKLGPGPRSLQGSRSASRSSKFDDLNSSWQNLQRQLGTKERELQLAIQKQERYQSAVQDVTARMELVQQKLLGVNFNPYKDMDRQMKDHRDAENEISSLREDIARVRERGRQIMETSDPEGYQAMQATLTMLSDKIENLQNMADDKAKQLQTAMKDREKHKIALVAYKKHVKEIEDWYDEMKVRQATTPQPTDGVTELQQQLLENKELQDQLNLYLQQVADLAIQCDSICEMEPPADADKLRSQLSTLQQNLGNLKLSAIEKQAPLRTAIKDSEKRKREMDDYESNVKHLQKWISDTKKLAAAPPAVEQMVTPVEKHQLQQQLQSDLFQHRNLVRQLSTEMRSRERESRPVHARMVQIVPVKEEDVQPRWEKLSKEMAEKKENLEELIRNTSDLIGPGKYGRRHYGPDTSSQLQDIRRHLGALTDLWKQLQVQVDDKQLRLEQALEFQQKYQDALQNVSGWLDLAEQKLFAPDANLNSEEKVKENEDIQREIKSLQGEILAMGHAAQELLAVANADSHDLIRHSLANLNDRVQILEGQAKEQGDKLRTIDRQYKQYQDEVRNLEGKMSETRDLMASPGASAPLNQRVASMQKIEAQLKKCESQMEDVKKRQSELSALDPEIISPHEMDSLQSNYMDLQRKVMEKKASLQQSVSVQEQYEKLLQDYADFLETADEKLKVEAISARDLGHLKQQLNAHKDFFCDLEVHRAMLDSLVAQCDKATKQKHLPSHTRLSNLTYVLQDKASLHGQRLDRLVRQWGEMDEKFSQLQRFLDDIEVQMPKPITNDDALPAIQGKIDTYNRLQRELNDEKPTVFQVVDRGKQLLHSINCPTLETLITDLADKWVNLNTDLSHQVKQSQSLGDQLQVFEAEAAVLKSWLSAARSKLTSIKQLSSTDLRSIAIVRNKIDKILEFRKEVENQLPLKDKVLSVGKQLLQNQVYQTADLDERLKHLELEWAHLEHDITNSEEYLHQAQMDLMPSRQALGELNAWLTEMEETLQEEKTKPMKNIADIEVLLKKYKSYKIDLSSKQLTVDFVNQDVLKPSEDSETPLPAEINEFSERLGTLNSRWEVVSRHVSDRLASLEGVHGKWEEFEKSLARLIGWFREQEDKIKKYHLIGHEVSVRQTLKDCKALKQTLRNKQHEMDQLKELGETLTELSQDAPGIKNLIHSNLESVKEHKQSLESQLNKVDKILEDVLAQWDSYHSELQVVSQTLAETEYCLQRYNLIGGDIATLKIQVEKLESLLHDMDKNTPHFEKFVALATRLSQVCEAPTRQEIQRTQADIQTRCQKMHGELRSHTEKFRDCLQQWLMYEEEYVRARTWLDVKENLCDDLLYGKEPRDNNLTNCQSLQQDLDNFQTQLSNLYRVGDDVTKNMDPSAIVNITSKLSGLEQRLLTLRQKIAKHIQSLQGDMSQHKRFQEAFDNVKAFISQAQRILGMDDPNKSADEKVLSDRLEYLKELLSQFSDNSAQLDSLNDLGYRLALNETAAADLQDLNHLWHDLFSETKERTKTLQGILLVQQDFTEKCDTWMAFLAQTEADLSTEIAGNLVDLCIQQRKCEKFESEMYSRQQILHAIISDGQTMMNNGDVEDREAFQQKLHLLAAQWQSVARRANQRKAIIDTTIKQWQAFNDSSEKLREWLADKEEGLQVFNFDTASLQKVKNLVEKAKQTQNEFKLQEDIFKSMNTQGNQLLLRADDTAQEELRVSMAQVQQHWHQIYVNLDGEREKLEGVLKQWRECEEDIEDILTWLKDTRKALSGGLPTAYEDLQADMHRCKDIESAFVHNEPKRQTLLTKERDLSKVIEPEDLNVLHQRIRLMNKQWEELRNQANLRGQRIDDTMFRWSNFSEKVKDLCDWIDKMEVKVISSKDYHIEDLLNRMQKDFKDEMMDKERSKNDLVDQGHQLIKVSSEVRASDIEQKVTRMEDKWEHLRAVIGFRERKLQETLLAVQQLDVSMSNLRKWLADMENDLAAPVVYVECSRKEIQKKLQHQNDLQHDIERHSPGVGSVLNLCEVLLHDSDACPTEVEFNGLQTAMKNLERRWRNICQMSPEQRTKIEETWTLWQTLMDDCRVFGDWLKVMEAEITDASPDQSNVSVTKEEFRRCEIAQRKIHENLSNLENINKQYRRLAREGRTDSTGTLKTMMQDANDRWDMLQGQMSAILRQLKHSSSIREDFKKTKESLLSWLTEIDMQLTNIDHLSSMDVHTKLREMDRIREEVANRDKKFAYLDEAGLYLIQKGDSADAIAVQAELDTFRQYYRQVMEKLTLTKVKLEAEEDLEKRQDEDELDQLERELYSLAPGETLDWDMREIEAYLESSPPDSPPEKRRALLRKIRERSRSRSTSPIKKLPSVTAATSSPIIGSSPTRKFTSTPRRLRSKSPVHRSTSPVRSTSPLRSTSPIRASSSPRTGTPRSGTPRSQTPTRSRSPTRLITLRAKSPMRVAQDYVDSRARSPTRQETYNRLRTELGQKGKATNVDDILEKLADALEHADMKLTVAERELRCHTPTGPGLEQQSADYLQSMSDAEKAVDDVRRIERLLKAETGLRVIASSDAEVRGIIQRWEMLQAGAIKKDYRLSQHKQEWSQFKADLENMMSWLDEAEALQRTHKPLPGEITKLDTIIRQHKDFLVQLDAKKSRVISLNLTSKEIMDLHTEEGRDLRDRLRLMNKRWDAICGQATRLQQELQVALMHCQEFHHTIHDLLLWLENIETKIQQCEPINLGNDEAALWSRLRKLQDIKFDLEKNQPRVMSLRDTADQLLINSDSPEMSNAKDKMHIIANRLKALHRLCSSYVTSLETRLDTKPASAYGSSAELNMSLGSAESDSPRGGRTSTPTHISRRYPFRPTSSSSSTFRPRTRSPFALTRELFAGIPRPWISRSLAGRGLTADTLTEQHEEELAERHCLAFCCRVLRAAIPLQLLILLLLGLAALVPMSEDDYSCMLANNFRRSLEQMLQYTDGPPPV